MTRLREFIVAEWCIPLRQSCSHEAACSGNRLSCVERRTKAAMSRPERMRLPIIVRARTSSFTVLPRSHGERLTVDRINSLWIGSCTRMASYFQLLRETRSRNEIGLTNEALGGLSPRSRINGPAG